MKMEVGKRYVLGKKLGSGSFGEIYAGTSISTNEEYAVTLGLFFLIYYIFLLLLLLLYYRSNSNMPK